MKNIPGLRVRNAGQPKSEYHPGNLTCAQPFKHDDAPPVSERVVVDRCPPVLYDANDRPLYRKVGFA